MPGFITTNTITIHFDLEPTEDGQWQVIEYDGDWSPRLVWTVPTQEIGEQLIKERKTQWKRMVNRITKQWKESPKWQKYQQERG